MWTPRSLDVISLEARYLGAWGEVAARIESRQTVGVSLAAAVLLGIGLTFESDELRRGAAVVLPILALVYSLWSIHNDQVISTLVAFCGGLEQYDTPSPTDLDVCWFSEGSEWIADALRARRFHDYGMQTLFFATLIPLSLEILHLNPNELKNEDLVLVIPLLAFMGAFGALIWSSGRREEGYLKSLSEESLRHLERYHPEDPNT